MAKIKDKSNELHELVKQSMGNREGEFRERSTQFQFLIKNNIIRAIKTQQGKPIQYASIIKGPMKVIFDNHHFYYKFRADEYTIYQCCYDNKKKKCSAKVVTYENLAYYFEPKHSHKLPATDKSVVSMHPKIDENISKDPSIKLEGVEGSIKDYTKIDIKEENITQDEFLEITDEIPKRTPVIEDPNEFREKIKKRLQKRLSRKVKNLK